METIYRIQLNIMAMAVLLFVFIIALRRLEQKDRLNRIFLYTSAVVILELIIETATVLINKVDVPGLAILSNILHVGLFTVSPILTYMFVLLMYRIVLPYEPMSIKHLVVLGIPVYLNFILVLLSPFYGLVFSIDATNTYLRGDWYWLAAVLTFGYMFYGIFFLLKHRKKLMANDTILFVLIGFLPLAGGIAQALVYGLLMVWSAAAAALVLSYIYLQERMVRLDAMTGAWTRESFFHVFERRILQRPEEVFGGIYIDIDGLKKINDVYGHAEGNQAIFRVVNVIRSMIRSNDNLVRLGGDEFLLLIETTNIHYLEDLVAKIRLAFEACEQEHQLPYHLTCSFGIGLYTDTYQNLDTFLHVIDLKMYEDKNRNANLAK